LPRFANQLPPPAIERNHPNMTRALIIDTDPSVDDAVAALVALASPAELEVLALTTVAGNVPVALTTKNALKVLALAGRTDIPVHPGATGPLNGTLRSAEYVQGATGMDGFELAEPATAGSGYAPDAIVDLVMARPAQSITLCCIAPMTNVALALRKAPAVAGRLREIVIMGGARSEGGNITPCAEFNVFVDPEAAHAVFTCGAPITLIPLDCTHQALTSAERLDRLRALGTPLAEALYHLLVFNKRFHERRCGTDGAPLHDATTIAYLLRPDLFTGRRAHVAVECTSELTRGMTVIDWWGVTGKAANAQVLTGIHAAAYFDLVIERLARLG
jgi:purine nucleosidase